LPGQLIEWVRDAAREQPPDQRQQQQDQQKDDGKSQSRTEPGPGAQMIGGPPQTGPADHPVAASRPIAEAS
jgi:hypothetical protein